MLLTKPSFYIALAGITAAVVFVQVSARKAPNPGPVDAPARASYASTVAATGLIEASRENVKLAAPKGGVVRRVFVQVGDTVKTGDPLFQLDARESAARLASVEAQLVALEAQRGVDDNAVADWSDQLARFERLERDQVATTDELKRRQFALAGARARLNALEAQIRAMKAQRSLTQAEHETLTVQAPRDGKILQVNVREGEFAPAATLAEPLMLLGDVDKLQVRAEVDEQNALLVRAEAPAEASIKGHAALKMKLRFVRIEPFVLPKRNLTGDSLERVDTRVLQVIYEFERPAFPVYVGQQVDVFIERAAIPAAASR